MTRSLPLRLLPLLATLPAALFGQAPVKPAVAAVSQLEAERHPVVALDDGVVRVAGRDFKAAVDAAGMQFVPFFGSDAPTDVPLQFTVRRVAVDGRELATASMDPKLRGDVIDCARAGFVESFRIDVAGLEQTFRFDRLDARGAVEIALDVAGDYAVVNAADGLHFDNQLGSVRYGRAVAIDARGARLDLETAWDGKGIRITVPERFVADAVLPLVVDPMVGVLHSTNSVRTTRSVDLSWDPSLERYAMVWERVYSATDSDVYAVALDRDLNMVGNVLIVDSTLESWQDPQVGSLGAYDRFLIVASRTVGAQDPWIAGRVVHSGSPWTLGPVLDIDRVGNSMGGAGRRLDPTIAGDQTPGSPSIAAVAWELVDATGRSQVRLCFVNQDGVRHVVGDFTASDPTHDGSDPELVEYLGPAPVSNYGLVYRRTVFNGSNTIEQLWSRSIPRGNASSTPTGALMALDADSVFSVSAAIDDGVSSDGTFMVVADTYNSNTGLTNIHASLVRVTGGWGSPTVDLTQLENLGSAHVQRVQRAPSVTTDGCRFAVAYQNMWSDTDADVRVMTVAWQRNNAASPFVVQDTAVVANTTDNETGPAIACARGTGDAVRCAVAWSFDGAAGFSVQWQGYDAMAAAGGITTRTTGCGGLQIQASGVPAIGHEVTIQVAAAGAVRGILVGRPVSVPIGACPGCTLGATDLAYSVNYLQLTIPCNPALVGGLVSFQGFDAASPACLGLVRLSDTIDVRMR